MYSIREELCSGRAVLLSGGTGFVGSLVLEQLLRCTEASVHVLIRPKRGVSAAQRLAQLLQRPPFGKATAACSNRVIAVEADLCLPGLGLPDDVRQALQQQVHFVIHAAADVALERPLQDSLQHNYCATQHLLQLVHGMRGVRAFVHVSTAFANMNQPAGSCVREQLYDLPMTTAYQQLQLPGSKGSAVQHDMLAPALLDMPAAEANAAGRKLLWEWGWPNTYTLTKHLAEKLVAQHHDETGLPVAIVRPSIVTSTARQPYCGHLGSWAGLAVWVLAIWMGIPDSKFAIGWRTTGSIMFDIIPADLCASAVLAATAATSSGVDKQITGGAGGPLIVHSATSGCKPLSTGLVWNTIITYTQMFKTPFCIRLMSLPDASALATRAPAVLLAAALLLTRLKVALVCLVLRVLGFTKQQRMLTKVLQGYLTVNNPRLDKDFRFDTSNLSQLQARMVLSEQAAQPLVFGTNGTSWETYLPTFLKAVYAKAGFN